jgi:multidrug efflux pump subunit AcrB
MYNTQSALTILLPVSFFPTIDPGSFTVGINLPPGTPLEKTNQLAREVERFAMAQPEVKQIYARVGQMGSANQGAITVQFKKGVKTDAMVKRFRESLSQYGRVLSFTQPRQFLGVGGGMGGAQVRSRQDGEATMPEPVHIGQTVAPSSLTI